MQQPNTRTKPTKKRMPILARHAVSLSVAFALGLVLSYFAGQYIHQRIQLGKLDSADQATFERGVGYVVTHAGNSEAVTNEALQTVQAIDPQRAAALLLAVAQSHASRGDQAELAMPASVTSAIAPLMQRLTSVQAIGLHDGLVRIKGVNPIFAAENLLRNLKPKDDAELLQIVDLLDTRLLWSKRWAPLDLWLQWLTVLAESDDELTQFNTAKRLGDLLDAADNPRIVQALTALASSEHETVRNRVLNACAGYAAIASDPTDYEQIVFDLGSDANKIIARRAWMVVGHLDPLSGFAINWQDADPFVAEAMLWAAVKTNPQNPKPAIDAFKSQTHQYTSIQALSSVSRQGNDDVSWLLISERWRRVYEDASPLLWRLVSASPPATRPRFDGDHQMTERWLGLTRNKEIVKDIDWSKEQHTVLAMTHLYSELPTYDYPHARAFQLAVVEGRPTIRTQDNKSLWIETSPSFVATYDLNDYPAEFLIIGGAAGLPLERPDIDLKKVDLADSVFRDIAVVCLLNQAAFFEIGPSVADFIRTPNPNVSTIGSLVSGIKQIRPSVIQGVTANLLRKHPDLTGEQLRAMSDEELAGLGLSRIDALPALLEAAEAAPRSANRGAEAKLLKLALWMRGDLGEDFTPTAEAMLFDDDLPTSTVLMCLLHMKRPVALDYLFGDLITPRPDLHKLFVQERYWHVFRRFVDTSDLTLWLWGDPEAQAFQLDAMRQWYAVNRWKIENGAWPQLIDD